MKDYRIPVSVAIPAAIGLVGVFWILRRKSVTAKESKKTSASLPKEKERVSELNDKTKLEHRAKHIEKESITVSQRKIPQTQARDRGSSDLQDQDQSGLAEALGDQATAQSESQNVDRSAKSEQAADRIESSMFQPDQGGRLALTSSQRVHIEHLITTAMGDGLQEAHKQLTKPNPETLDQMLMTDQLTTPKSFLSVSSDKGDIIQKSPVCPMPEIPYADHSNTTGQEILSHADISEKPLQEIPSHADHSKSPHADHSMTPVWETHHAERSATPLQETPHADHSKIPVRETPHADHFKTPVRETPHADHSKTPVRETLHTDSSMIPVRETPQADCLSTPVLETPHADHPKTPVRKISPHTDHFKTQVQKTSYADHSKTSVLETPHADHPKTSVQETSPHAAHSEIPVQKTSHADHFKTPVQENTDHSKTSVQKKPPCADHSKMSVQETPPHAGHYETPVQEIPSHTDHSKAEDHLSLKSPIDKMQLSNAEIVLSPVQESDAAMQSLETTPEAVPLCSSDHAVDTFMDASIIDKPQTPLAENQNSVSFQQQSIAPSTVSLLADGSIPGCSQTKEETNMRDEVAVNTSQELAEDVQKVKSQTVTAGGSESSEECTSQISGSPIKAVEIISDTVNNNLPQTDWPGTSSSPSPWLTKTSLSSVDSFGPEEIESIWGISSSTDTNFDMLSFVDADSVLLVDGNSSLDHITTSSHATSSVNTSLSESQKPDAFRSDGQQISSNPATAYLDKDTKNDSPSKSNSPVCDNNSEGSNDSGRGGSEHDAACHGVEALVHFDFNMPSELCGRFIGRHGRNINFLKEKTGAHISLANNPFTADYQICQIVGTQGEVDDTLHLIKKKFPLQDYPQMTMTPINMSTALTSQPEQPLVIPDVMQLSLPEGVSVEVFVSAIVDAGHIFVQQPTHRSFMSLEKLNYFMGQVYSQDPNVPSVPAPVESGIICVCENEGFWYRAMIMSAEDENGEAQVKFVDYGGYAMMPVASLKQIRADFMSLPFQAVECFMANITPNQNEQFFSNEATMALSEMTQGKLLHCQVIARIENGIPYVHLYQINTESNSVSAVMINRALVNSCLVRWFEIL